MKDILLFGQKFISGNTQEIIELIYEKRDKSQYILLVAAINVYIITLCYKNKAINNFYNHICDIVTVDGRPLVYLSKFYSNYPFPEMVGGPNLWQKIINIGAAKGDTFYFLGATNEILVKAINNLRLKIDNIKIIGFHHGYLNFPSEEFEEVVAEINNLNPNFIYIGISSPKKEECATLFRKKINKGIIVLIGGAFDYLAEEKKIGNNLISKLCLDWFFRMLQEPRRLLPRYFKSNLIFLKLIIISFFKKKLFKLNK